MAPIYIMEPVEDPKSYKPLHCYQNLNKKEFYCLICMKIMAANGADKKDWNALLHTKRCHILEYPINCWEEDDMKSMQGEWEAKLQQLRRGNKVVQKTITQMGEMVRDTKAQTQMWTEAVVTGFLPLGIQRNEGTKRIIKFMNNGKIPRGVSYYHVKKNLDYEYKKYLKEKQRQLGIERLEGIPLLHDDIDPYKLQRIYGFAHDIWSNRNGQAFMAATLSVVNTALKPWKMESVRVLTEHEFIQHSAENNLNVCLRIINDLGISTNNILATISDTTGNAINTFNTVPSVGQLLCSSHTNELICKHAVSDYETLNNAIDSIKKLMVRAKGNKSSKRRDTLQQKCDDASINFCAVYLPAETRWGGHVVMISCFLKLKAAFDLYDADTLPTTSEEQASFTSLLEDAEFNLDLVKACMPVLSVLFEWTQILTVGHTPTIGLFLLAHNRINAALRHMLYLSSVDNVETTLRHQIRTAHDCFERRVQEYYNEDFLDFWIYTVAAFLDPRGFPALRPTAWSTAASYIKKMCTEEEVMSEHDLNERAAANPGRRVRQRGGGSHAAAQPTEEEEALAAIRGDCPTYSKVVPLTTEIVTYIALIRKTVDEAHDKGTVPDSLEFWSENEDLLPILARFASRVLPSPTANGDPERTNSRGGLIYTPRRNRVMPATAQKLVFLYDCYMQTEPRSRRAVVAQERAERFITQQSIDCKRGDDGVEFLNSLCPWIYYEDDTDDEDIDDGEAGDDQDAP